MLTNTTFELNTILVNVVLFILKETVL